MTPQSLVRLILPLVLLSLASSLTRAQTNTFDSNDQGWTLVSFSDLMADNYSILGTYTPIYSATGGNPGGYIGTNDPDGGDTTFSAPATILGDRTAAIGTTFTYDLMHSGADNYDTTDVIFQGNGTRLLWEANPPLVTSSTWMNVSVTLAPSGQWHLNTTGGVLATMSDFQNVFSNLSGIFIRGEYTNGAESDGLDNVHLVPEPATTSLLVTALAAIAFLSRRKGGRSLLTR